MSTLSVFIPHVFANITEERIKNIFHTLSLGKVSHVDLVRKQGKYGNRFNAAYIHFDYWYACPAAQNLQERILNPTKEARIVYDDPWFWNVFENNSQASILNAPVKAPIINKQYIWDSDLEPTNLFESEEAFRFTDSSYIQYLESQIQLLKKERDASTKEVTMLRLENNELNNKIDDLENDYWSLAQKCDIAENNCNQLISDYNNEINIAEHENETQCAELNRIIEYWKTEYDCKEGEVIYLRGIIGDDY